MMTDTKEDMVIHEIRQLIYTFFDGDNGKTYLWFITENPELGGIRPIDIIKMGKSDKLLKFVKEIMNR